MEKGAAEWQNVERQFTGEIYCSLYLYIFLRCIINDLCSHTCNKTPRRQQRTCLQCWSVHTKAVFSLMHIRLQQILFLDIAVLLGLYTVSNLLKQAAMHVWTELFIHEYQFCSEALSWSSVVAFCSSKKQFLETHTGLLKRVVVLSSSLEVTSGKQSSAMATGRNHNQRWRTV